MVAWKKTNFQTIWASPEPWKNFIVRYSIHFRPFYMVLAVKLMPHSQFSFESWLYNVDLDLYFFFLNQHNSGLKKGNFQTAWASLEPWTNFTFWHPVHFNAFFNFPEKKLMPFSQISFKSLENNVDSDLYVFI